MFMSANVSQCAAHVNRRIAYTWGPCYQAAMITGKDIKRHRDRLRESQAEFAKRLGVNQTTISRWESGDLAIEGVALVAVEYVLAELSQ